MSSCSRAVWHLEFLCRRRILGAHRDKLNDIKPHECAYPIATLIAAAGLLAAAWHVAARIKACLVAAVAVLRGLVGGSGA